MRANAHRMKAGIANVLATWTKTDAGRDFDTESMKKYTPISV